MASIMLPDAPGRSVLVRGHRYPVVLPSWRDPRLHLAVTITTLHVLGQVAFGFDVSIAQILVALGTCGGVEFIVRFVRDHEVAWPTHGFLAGNGIAFLLRVEGTVPGDRWSLRGAWIFAATGAVAVGARYLVRVGGRPLFNPSNVALVGCFLVLGTNRVNPLDLWWAPMSPAMVLAYAVIILGAMRITWRTGTWPMSVVFAVTFSVLNGAVARGGHCMVVRWSVGPVCDTPYWWLLTTSPEILIFSFFMITDPRTAPRGRVARMLYAGCVAVLASGLASTQTKEFGTKVAVLGALVIGCALRPVFEAVAPAAGDAGDRFWRWASTSRDGNRTGLGIVRLATGSMCAITAVLGVATLGVAVGDDLRPAGALPAESVVVEPISAALLPPVVVDSSVGEASISMSPARAEAMAADLVRALRAIDEALDGNDTATVRGVVTRRYLATLEPSFGSGQVIGYEIASLAVAVLRGDDSQAPPRVVLRAEGIKVIDGEAFVRVFPMVEVGGRWVLDGDLDPVVDN